MRSLSPSQSWNGIWSGRRWSAVFVLMALNVVVFIAQGIEGIFHSQIIEEWFAFSKGGLKSGYVWQLVTYMFLHDNPWHILVNMLVLYFSGRHVESMLGPRRLCLIFFMGGFVGALLQMIGMEDHALLLGASAGVSAVLLAFTTLLPEMEISMLLFFVFPIRMKAKYLGWGIIVMSILFALVPKWGGSTGHLAHLGGAIFGLLYIKLTNHSHSPWRPAFRPVKISRREIEEDLSPSEFISEQIDPILDKISKEGIHSLSHRERKILEKGREKIAQKTSRRHI